MELRAGYKNTEIGVIPEDWKVEKIDDVLKVSTGSKNTQDKLKDGKYPFFVRSQTIERINSFAYDCEAVLTAGDGVGTGKIFHYVNGKFELHQRVYIMNNFKKNLLGHFFFLYFSNNFYDRVMQMTAKSSVDSVRREMIAEMQIPLPPLPEQTAIANLLSDTDNLLQTLQKKIAKKRLIKQGAMQELLKPKEDWVINTLGEIANFRRGSFPQPYGLDQWYDENNGMPFVQVFDVDKNMKLKPTTKQKISDLAKDKSVFVKKGNIILTIQGSIGRIAVTQYDSYVDRTLLIFTEYKIPMDIVFFSFIVQEKFRIEKENAPGGIIKTITKEALSKFKMVFPKSKEEQNKIATILSDMDTEIESLEKQLAKYKQVKQGLMQNLLTGKIRLV